MAGGTAVVLGIVIAAGALLPLIYHPHATSFAEFQFTGGFRAASCLFGLLLVGAALL